MSAKHKIHLRRIDYVNRKLPLFCFIAKNKLNKKFRVEKGGIVFQLELGLTEDSPNWYSYTDIHFEAELDTDLALFEQEIPLIVDSDNLKIVSAEGAELERAKEAERAKLEEQLRDLFPLALQSLNTFRRACKVALFRESVEGRILVQNIQASQLHWGTEVHHPLAEYFAGNDTEYLFGAFAELSLSSFTGDAVLEYRVSNAPGQVLEGTLNIGYSRLRSPDRLPQKSDEIQQLIRESWPITDDVLLTSLEFLYSDNYRMAVFNATIILELVVIQFWEEKKKQLSEGGREDQEKLYGLKRKMDDSGYSTSLEKILRIVLPEFIDRDLLASGSLDRCADAWDIRNKRLAHLYRQVKEGKETQITSTEAWNTVGSIIALIDSIAKVQP